MEVDEALDKISEIGITPEFFCELQKERCFKEFIRGYHKSFHSDTNSGKTSAVYAKKTAALTSLSRLDDSELSFLVKKIETNPSHIRDLEDTLTVLKDALSKSNQKVKEYMRENEEIKKHMVSKPAKDPRKSIEEIFIDNFTNYVLSYFKNKSNFPENSHGFISEFLDGCSTLVRTYA